MKILKAYLLFSHNLVLVEEIFNILYIKYLFYQADFQVSFPIPTFHYLSWGKACLILDIFANNLEARK